MFENYVFMFLQYVWSSGFCFTEEVNSSDPCLCFTESACDNISLYKEVILLRFDCGPLWSQR